MENPLFSILIAQYNNGKYFADCYNSIMAQTYANWEVIIVDDASTDDSAAVMKNIIGNDARFKLEINAKNEGCGYTKRRCAELASGALCAFLDPDDAITGEALEVMVEEHAKHPDASMIYSNLLYCDENLSVRNENKSRKIENADPFFLILTDSPLLFFLLRKSFMIERKGSARIYRERLTGIFYSSCMRRDQLFFWIKDFINIEFTKTAFQRIPIRIKLIFGSG